MLHVEIRNMHGKLRAKYFIDTMIDDNLIDSGGNWFPGVVPVDDRGIVPEDILDFLLGMMGEVNFTKGDEIFDLEGTGDVILKWRLTGRLELDTVKDLKKL